MSSPLTARLTPRLSTSRSPTLVQMLLLSIPGTPPTSLSRRISKSNGMRASWTPAFQLRSWNGRRPPSSTRPRPRTLPTPSVSEPLRWLLPSLSSPSERHSFMRSLERVWSQTRPLLRLLKLLLQPTAHIFSCNLFSHCVPAVSTQISTLLYQISIKH